MRISDWSSDVCSSDLFRAPRRLCRLSRNSCFANSSPKSIPMDRGDRRSTLGARRRPSGGREQNRGKASCSIERDRKSVVQGKSVSVRVDLGGRRIIKKKKKQSKHTVKTV